MSESNVPLPLLADERANDTPVSVNDWQILVHTAPLHAETPLQLPVAGVKGKIGQLLRSPFRSGEIRLDPIGITLEGIAIKSVPRWAIILRRVASIVYLPLYIIIINSKRWSVPLSLIIILGGISMCLLIAAIWMQQYLERQRTEVKQLLSWESVYAIRIGPQMKHLTIVVSSMNVAAAKAPTFEYIPLTKWDTNLVHGVANTIRHYAPHTLDLAPLEKKRERQLWIFAAILYAIVLIFMAAIFYYRRHPSP